MQSDFCVCRDVQQLRCDFFQKKTGRGHKTNQIKSAKLEMQDGPFAVQSCLNQNFITHTSRDGPFVACSPLGGNGSIAFQNVWGVLEFVRPPGGSNNVPFVLAPATHDTTQIVAGSPTCPSSL